jgi:hypothetical protein
MKEVSIIGVDLAKNVFQVHGAAADGILVRARDRSAHTAPVRLPPRSSGIAELAAVGADRRQAFFQLWTVL